jgi:hypothetical protein
MTYTHKHLYIRLNGGLGGSVSVPNDKWSTGFRIAVPGADIDLASPALLTLVNSIHAAAITLHGTVGMLAGTNCNFLYVTGARVGLDGKYDPLGQTTVVSTGLPQAGSGVPGLPFNTALSFGLRTAVPRGYASNGRLYYPFLAGAVTAATGRVSTTAVTNRLAAMKTFLNAVNTAANTYQAGAVLCVMSKVGSGTTQRVLSIRSDDRLDSIERRENDQPSAYSTLTL